MEEEKLFSGVTEDPRTEEEQDQDYQADEVASFAPIAWVEKPREQWRKFPSRDQDGSGSCVAQTGGKMLGIENQLEEGKFIEFSARDIYERRANKPGEGMWGQNALDICSKFGATTEERMPSQRMNESQMNAPLTRSEEDLQIARKYRGGGYVELAIDIDKIADVILNKGKGVMLFIYADYSEWTDVPTTKFPNLTREQANVRHSITGVDAFLYNGEKAILIDDSWGKFYGLDGQRILTESFLKARGYFAGYLLDLSNAQPQELPKPKHRFNRTLTFGMVNNADVRAFQDILKHEGLFPKNVVSTGNYLQITAKAILAWQKNHDVAPLAELEFLKGRRCGPKTIARLNELYGQ